MRTSSIQLGHHRLSYRESVDCTPQGTHPAVLLHRAGGSSRDWEPQLTGIGLRRRAIAPDFPGHGQSEDAPLGSIREMAVMVAGMIEALGLERVVLVGHSMGGAVALELAIECPEVASALLLVASGARLRVAKPVLAAVRERFELLPELMGRMIFAPSISPEVLAVQIPLLFDAPAEVVLSDLEACQGFDAEPRLGRLGQPLTVLIGSEDFLTPPRLGRRLIERVTQGRLEVVKAAGHLLPQERPELVTELILELTSAEGADR